MIPSAYHVAAKISSGSPVYVAWLGIAEPVLADIFAREGYDAVVFDGQHGMFDDNAMARGFAVVSSIGVPVLGRIPVGNFAAAARFLDLGATGVIAPMINSVEDASRLVAFTKFPPVGERSWGPARALALTGLSAAEYFKQANDFSLVIAMIETREAIAAVDDILAVPGLDGVFVGPSDLSITLSNGASFNPASAEVDAAFKHVLARAKAAGKFCGAFGISPAKAAELGKQGFQLITVSGDFAIIKDAAKNALAIARGG
ncbi:4-hydroxy-2-oxoheptanedioate aldolase [Rhizobiales bacterium GAS191]|jgi:4-hydroxy-2-oxoheptanedioate aldolase|nr:4-hydroxy-2-oxoheptanedioate aldolase [Rhizobiales bacterium GAS113]SEB91025.1 4-hydroxy-2-oxoheptanedioate aldolase [Rhizobiales bacterium GAS191]